MPKIDRAHKNYITPEISEEMHLREIFYGTLIFQHSSMICIDCHVGGHTLPSNMAAKTTFCLYLVKCLIVQMCYKRYHIIFSTFSVKFKCKICVQKAVIHNFKNQVWVM